MSKLLSKTINNYKVECYSERGILAYFSFHFLPVDNNFTNFINKISFYSKKDIFPKNQSINNPVIFSELDFGNKGFGNPDGALAFEVNNKKYFIFIEAKFNETYIKSCNGKNYNSTIKGQIELKLRFANQVYHKNDKYKNYVIENNLLRDFYKANDIFYQKRAQDDTLGSFRKLMLKEGVERLISEYIIPCTYENIYFLIITRDNINPIYSLDENLRPAFPGVTWDEIKNKLFWMPASFFENL
jgi:hypothetical protein